MARIEVREQRATRGLVTLGTGFCMAVALGLLLPVKGGLDQPSRPELSRQEAAARQQADLDSAWRPWVTGAENLMVVSLCVTASFGIAGMGLAGVRLFVRGRRPTTGGLSSGNQEVRDDRPQPQGSDRTGSGPAATRPRSDQRPPQGLDMTPLHAGAAWRATGQRAATTPLESGELLWPTVA
ncbi:MAG: hypothetical protein JWM18_4519 [Chloroflexi bacterium]|jgi:hypothetical protein|nr:hypothetical protein [Chloroflexota bacterium]